MKKSNKIAVILIVVISLSLIIISSVAVNLNKSNGQPRSQDAVKIDLEREEEYELYRETDKVDIYSFNANGSLYLFLEFNVNTTGKSINFRTGDVRYDLSAGVINTSNFLSLKEGNIAELKISEELVGPTINFEIEDFTKVPTPGYIPISGFTPLSVIGIVFLLLFVAILVDRFKSFKDRKWLFSYKETQNDDGSSAITELKNIGELKGKAEFNAKKRCFELLTRIGIAKYRKIYSDLTFEQFNAHHLIKKEYLVRYLCNTLYYEKELDEKDYYETEIGYTKKAYAYMFFSYLFSLDNLGSFFLSMVSMGIIFIGIFTPLGAQHIGLLSGMPVGIIVAGINTYLQRNSEKVKNLLKKKKELVTKEYFLIPLESDEELLDIYHVWGTKTVIKDTADNTQSYVEITLKDEKKPTKEKYAEKWDEKGKFMTVRGYDKVYEMKDSNTYNIEDIEVVDIERRKRTNQEMRNLKRTWLSRNKALAEDKFRLQEMLERIEQKNRRLQEERLKEVEKYINQLDKFSKTFIKNAEETGTSLKKIYEEIKGSQFVAENFEETHERVMRRLREEEERTKANEIGNLIKALNITIEKIGGKYGIDVEELKNVLSVDKEKNKGEKSVKSEA
jgi:hypothetical protein